MKLTFEPLGNFVKLIDERNSDLLAERVLGISIDKYFMPSVANVIGTDLSNYKLLRKGRFACNPMHVGRDGRLPVARFSEDSPAIVSPAYFMFEVSDDEKIDPDYLMLCFRRPDFDRMCWFRTDASVRSGITWDDVCDLVIPVPSIAEQRRIVHEYKVVSDRIKLLQDINNNVDLQIQAIYRKMFTDDESVIEKRMPLDEMCLDIQRGYTPIYDENGHFRDLNQKVNKGIYLDKKFFATISDEAIIPQEKFARKKDILINYLGDGTLGRVHYYNEETTDVVVNQFIIIIRPDQSLLIPAYLYSVLSSPLYQQIIMSSVSGSTGMLVLNISTIRGFEIPIPPIGLQKRFEKNVAPLWDCITTNYSEINTLERLAEEIVAGLK